MRLLFILLLTSCSFLPAKIATTNRSKKIKYNLFNKHQMVRLATRYCLFETNVKSIRFEPRKGEMKIKCIGKPRRDLKVVKGDYLMGEWIQ